MKKRINLSLDETTVKKLKELADLTHRNMSQWVTEVVWESAKKYEEQNKAEKREK